MCVCCLQGGVEATKQRTWWISQLIILIILRFFLYFNWKIEILQSLHHAHVPLGPLGIWIMAGQEVSRAVGGADWRMTLTGLFHLFPLSTQALSIPRSLFTYHTRPENKRVISIERSLCMCDSWWCWCILTFQKGSSNGLIWSKHPAATNS